MTAGLDLQFRIGADVAGARAGIDQLIGGVDRLTGSLGRVGQYGAGLLIGLPALQGMAQQAVAAADAVTTMRNRLELATGSAAQASVAFDRLFTVAQQSRTSFTELGSVYATLARSGQQSIAVVQAIGNAMAIGGGSAEGMRAALVQLGQGMSAGALRGEELNSVMEQAPRLAQALADGLGVPIGALRRLGEQGQLTTERVTEALMNTAPKLADEMARSQSTASQAFTVLGNATTRFVGDVDKATGATQSLAKALGVAADAVNWLGAAIRNNETAFAVIGAALAGAAVVSGVGAVAAGMTKIAGAVGAIGAALVANPGVAALLGLGAVVGAGAAVAGAQAKTADGLRDAIAALESANERSQAALQRALDGGRKAGADNIQALINQRKEQIKQLNAELAGLSAEGLDTRAEDARFQRSREAFDAQERMRARVLEIQQKLSGVDQSYTKVVTDLAQALRDGVITYREYVRLAGLAWQQTKAGTAAQRESERAQKDAQKQMAEALAARNREMMEADAEVDAYLQRQLDAADSEAKAAIRAAAAAQEEFDNYGKLKSQIAEVTLLRLKETYAALEATDARRGSLYQQIEAQEKLIDVLKKAEQRDAAIEAGRQAEQAAQKALDQWKRASDQIEQSLTDALMRGFESGRGFVDSLVSTIKSAFQTMVLRPVVQAIVRPISGVALSALGMAGPAGAAQAGASALGGLSGFGGMLGGLGGTFGAGLGMTMSGFAGTSLALEGAGAMLANGSVLQGLAQGAGALGPYAMAAMAIYSIAKSLDKSGTPHTGSVVSVDAMGRATTGGSDPSNILRNFNKATDTALKSLGSGAVGILNMLGGGGYSAQAKFTADGVDASFGDFVLSRGGATVADIMGGQPDGAKAYARDREQAFEAYAADVASTLRQALNQIDLPQWARDQLAELGSDATIDQIQAVAQSISTLQDALRGLRAGFAQMGTVFADLAGLSGDALHQLAEFAGGADALGQQTITYLQEYYGRDEIAALKAREIQTVLSNAGISTDVNTREQFRAIVDSLDVGTEAGRRQLATLLGISGSFAGVADYLTETGSTLNDVAARAPDMATISPLLASGAAQVTAINEVRDAVNGLHQTIVQQGASAGAAARTGGGTLPAWQDEVVVAP